jgi:antitoxin CptB
MVKISALDSPLDERGLSQLKWRCRRGMLENDLFLERFLRYYGPKLSAGQARCVIEMMELSDNDLLDLHLGRKALAQVDSRLDRDDVREVLEMLKNYR